MAKCPRLYRSAFWNFGPTSVILYFKDILDNTCTTILLAKNFYLFNKWKEEFTSSSFGKIHLALLIDKGSIPGGGYDCVVAVYLSNVSRKIQMERKWHMKKTNWQTVGIMRGKQVNSYTHIHGVALLLIGLGWVEFTDFLWIHSVIT